MTLKVVFAVYGGLRDGNQDSTEAKIATGFLQTAIDRSPNRNGVVTINNTTTGSDPAKGFRKKFGAIVEVDGAPRPFACLENLSREIRPSIFPEFGAPPVLAKLEGGGRAIGRRIAVLMRKAGMAGSVMGDSCWAHKREKWLFGSRRL